MTSEPVAQIARSEQDPRVYLAAERTLLAWIRTGLAMMGFGFVVARFGLFLREIQSIRQPQAPRMSLWFGVLLVVMGAVVNMSAALSHLRLIAEFRQGTWTPGRPSRSGLVISMLLACTGVVVAAWLLVVR